MGDQSNLYEGLGWASTFSGAGLAAFGVLFGFSYCLESCGPSSNVTIERIQAESKV